MRRLHMSIAVLGLMAGITVTVAAAQDERSAATSTSAQLFDEQSLVGFESEALAEMPPQARLGQFDSAELVRYSLEPGGHFSCPFPGPALLYVESGALELVSAGGDVTVAQVAGPRQTTNGVRSVTLLGPSFGTASKQFTLRPGDYVYAGDGELGPVRNAGDERLELVALLLLPVGRGDSEAGEATAVPAGEG